MIKGPKMKVKDLDMFFISYDEPKKEEFWEDLKEKFPRAKRVDGVKGFDAAHKQCATDSYTSHFITVDGDCMVDAGFDEEHVGRHDNVVYSFSTKNIINGLQYGNGSLKVWPKQKVLSMKTHENAENEKSKVDFCWDITYLQRNAVYATTYPNATPFQAFRAGFREAIKMGLEQGERVKSLKLREELYPANYHRLLIWCNIGRDVRNGDFAIYGARLGIYKLYLTEFDYSLIRDYDWFDEYWENLTTMDPSGLIRKNLFMPIVEMDGYGSAFFKEVYINPLREENE